VKGTVPVYKRLFDSPFWKEKPAFAHFIKMAETGVPVSYAGSPTPAAGDECQKKIVEIYTRYAKG
jgi:hypothetical protein